MTWNSGAQAQRIQKLYLPRGELAACRCQRCRVDGKKIQSWPCERVPCMNAGRGTTLMSTYCERRHQETIGSYRWSTSVLRHRFFERGRNHNGRQWPREGDLIEVQRAGAAICRSSVDGPSSMSQQRTRQRIYLSWATPKLRKRTNFSVCRQAKQVARSLSHPWTKL